MERLKRLRTARNLSQTKLAQLADLNPATVNQIERGAREASPATLRKLADALEVTLYELMEEEAPKAQAPPSPEPEKVSEEERRAVDIGQETPADRIEVLEQGWIPPVRERVERWRAEIDGWRRQGTYPYGRADEMDTYAKVRVLQRAEEIGLMDHVRAVLEREKEVSEREFEACRLLNNELFKQAFALVIKAFEAEHDLGPERQGREEGNVVRLDALRQDSRPRSTRVRSA